MPASDFDWQDGALCSGMDPNIFFNDEKSLDKHYLGVVREICSNCAVSADCLQTALSNDDAFGIWGGTTERERRRMKKRLPVQRSPSAS